MWKHSRKFPVHTMQFLDKVVIPFRQRRISASQLCCGDASPSAELRSRRNLCNKKCQWCRQLEAVDTQMLQVIVAPIEIPVLAQRQIQVMQSIQKTLRDSSCNRVKKVGRAGSTITGPHEDRGNPTNQQTQSIDRAVNAFLR